MKTIALTGNIGSGKSLICKTFQRLGVAVFEADVWAKKLYENKSIIKEIENLFGEDIFSDGVLDKKKLADIVFDDTEALSKLENIIHPKVLEKFQNWKELQSGSYCIMENAILYEKNWEKYFDKVIVIDSPAKLSLQRAAKRGKCSIKEIEKRMKKQIPIEEKIKRADFVIHHDNETMLLEQIIKINDILK